MATLPILLNALPRSCPAPASPAPAGTEWRYSTTMGDWYLEVVR